MEISIAQESLDEIEELRRRHQKAAQALIASGDTPVIRMLAYIATKTGEKWEADAPWLYGVLAHSTRERIFDGVGKAFIDPTITHPVLGGMPVVYGPVVHLRQPWVANIFTSDVPKYATEGVVKFFGELSDIYT